jgi:translation initiation factor 1
VVRVGRETKGRGGKGVTIISDLPLDENGLAELATKLKARLGTGGTVKDGKIEIQGDQRDRIVAELEGMGYRAKRAGGYAIFPHFLSTMRPFWRPHLVAMVV